MGTPEVIFHPLAARFRSGVDRAVQRIATDPESLARLGTAYRWVRIQRFPYVLIFREQDADTVMVVAVAHASRRPGYWRRRG